MRETVFASSAVPFLAHVHICAHSIAAKSEERSVGLLRLTLRGGLDCLHVRRPSKDGRVEDALLTACSQFPLMLPPFFVGAEEIVAVGEDGRVRAIEGLVVEVMVHWATPERDEVRRVEGYIVSAVIFDGFPETHAQVDPEREEVSAEQQWPEQRAESEDNRLDWVRVFRRDAEGRLVLVVHLVHILVDLLPMQEAVHPVKVKVLNHEEGRDLPQQLREGWQRSGDLEAEEVHDEVEGEHHRELDENVREDELAETTHLLRQVIHLVRLDLVLVHGRHGIENQPRHVA